MTEKERDALYTDAQTALSESREANLRASAIIEHIRGIEKMFERRTEDIGHDPERRGGA